MRTLYTLSASLLLLSAQAQWPTDPNAPLVICNEASDQTDMRLLADGDGGWLVLWRDNRLGGNRYGVFGQRLDAQGNLLWEPSGRLIQEVPGRSINMIGASRFANNNLFLAYISGADPSSGDTVRAMAYDSEGAPVWAEPTLLAYPGPLPGGGTSGGNYYPRVTAVLGGIYVGWGTNPMGAADYIYIARVKPDGTTDMPEQGVAVSTMNNPISAGPWTFRHDLVGGLMIERRWSNGAGAPLRAMRVDSMGLQLWPTFMEVSANSSGLGYEWSTAMASNGRLNSVWGYGYDLRMAIYDTTGVLFNPTAPIPVCLQADVQENPFVVQSDNETTLFWADNRAAFGGGRQVFMQRFDATGATLLAADGVLAMQCNGNTNGFPRAIAAENGSHIVAMVAPFASGGATPGFRVGRITPTGANLWSDTTRFCTPQLGPNAGTDFAMTSDGDGGVMAAWFNWEINSIYAARLDRWGRMGDFTGVEELERSTLSLFPNPATDRITLQSRDGSALGMVRIISAEGRTVQQIGMQLTDRAEMDIQGLAPGMYTVIASTRNLSSHLRFVKE